MRIARGLAEMHLSGLACICRVVSVYWSPSSSHEISNNFSHGLLEQLSSTFGC